MVCLRSNWNGRDVCIVRAAKVLRCCAYLPPHWQVIACRIGTLCLGRPFPQANFSRCEFEPPSPPLSKLPFSAGKHEVQIESLGRQAWHHFCNSAGSLV